MNRDYPKINKPRPIDVNQIISELSRIEDEMSSLREICLRVRLDRAALKSNRVALRCNEAIRLLHEINSDLGGK